MFGNSAVTSTWGNPQQNQPQQNPSAFGQPAGFGTAGNAFGQNPQPQANPMFGNLAANPNPGTSTGFGAFGAANTTTNPSNTLFGTPKPATGFGAFGGGTTTSTFGTGAGVFGQNTSTSTGNAGTGLFGQPASTTNAFGTTTGTGLFNKPAATFGSTQGTTQTSAYDGVPPVTTGSANPPYAAFSEKDAANSSLTLQYQSISCIPQYRGSSFEEIRLQDYMQGRKTAGAFGQSATFGTAPAPATSIFGAPAQNTTQQTTSLFGNTNPNPTTFGTFGQTNATQPASTTTGTGLFGAFGQPQQQQQTTAFGTFGQNNQQPAAQTGANPFGGSAFGANKPTTFGAFGTGGTTFGSGGAFGSQQQPAQQTATTGTNLFGQQPQQGSTFGAFGANNAASKPSIFGTAQPATQTTGAFGTFGHPQNAQGQQSQQQPGLFGTGPIFNQQTQPQQQQPNQQPSGGLFGNTQPNQSGGLFGNTGLFGANAQQPNTQQGQPQNTFANLFNKPAAQTSSTTGLFGNFGAQGSNPSNPTATGQQPSLFGVPNANQQQSTATSGFGDLFGKTAAPAMGQSQSNVGQPAGGLGGMLFGNSYQAGSLNLSANAPGAQGSLTASISQPIGANLPIFSMLPPGPHAVTLEQQTKKKPGFFVDIPTRSPVPRLQLSYTPANTKLRGFGSSFSASSLGAGGSNSNSSNISFNTGKPNALSLNRVIENKMPIGPDALLGRSSSPSLGSGGRQSVKKLILDKKVDPSDLFNKSGSPSTHRSNNSVTFSPGLSVIVREKEAADAAHPNTSPTPATRGQRGHNRFTAHSTHHVLENNNQDSSAERTSARSGELQEGDYWVKPDLDTLKHAGYEELLSFKGLVVGRIGYGEIEFLDAVDLTGLPKLGALLGEVVRFDDKECSVYPDVDEVDKPPPGTGLNVRARISLVRCWAQDKATREPIKDEKNPLAIRHLKRLKGMKDTHFESWDMEEGKWIFTVDHF